MIVAVRLSFYVILLLCAARAIAENEDSAATDRNCGTQTECVSRDHEPNENSWVDQSYNYMTTRADSLAVWLDSFFGRPESDLEAADSVLRLRMEQEWDERDDDKTKIRLTGKVDLPRLDRRLSLVFSEEGAERDALVPDVNHRDEDVGLQYQIRDRDHSRLYLSVGTNSSLDFKSSVRYKFVETLNDEWRGEFSERLYYTEDDGFGTLTRVGLDYALTRDRLVRWMGQADYGEETDGVRWSSRISYQTRIDERSAFSYFGSVSGVTDPHYLTDAYALGVRYRRSVFRRWIFFEIEPAHVWRRPELWEPRQSVWLLTLRIELLEELKNRRRRR